MIRATPAADRGGEHAAYSVVVPAPADSAPADPGMPPASTDGAAGPETPTFLRRFGALFVDWVIAQLIVVLVLRIDTTSGGAPALIPVGVFALYTVLLLALTGGATIGHRLFGLQVWKVRPGAFALQVVIRTLLLCLVIPAVLTSRDGRGFHDVAAGTRIVRP